MPARCLRCLARERAPQRSPAEFAFRPHPGAELPLAVILDDEQARARPLAAFFTGKPVVLVLEYLHCRTFCGLTLRGLMTALDGLKLDAGRDFRLVAISIDPRDTPEDAAAAKASYLAEYHHPDGANGVHFLTGSEAAVRRIAEAVGFPYRYDATLDQFIHPAGLVIASPQGRISRYLLGLDRSAAELEAGLATAARGQAFDVLRPDPAAVPRGGRFDRRLFGRRSWPRSGSPILPRSPF